MSFTRMDENPLPGPGPAPAPEEVPWWLKYGGRGLGTFGGIGKFDTNNSDFAIILLRLLDSIFVSLSFTVAMGLGVVNIISNIFTPICIFAGILQV